ncbi:MAG: energy transducer TonB [Flavobacteriales bacterium]|nr:energy transducer TonB [Flavobacteriales bacterium]
MGTLITVVVLLGISLLLTIDSSWMNVLLGVRNNVVFARHNKAYGAYMLRTEYNKRLGVSLALGIGVVLLAIGAPMVAKMFGGEEVVEVKKKIVDVNMELFEEEEEKPEEIKEPEVIEQPKIETVQFVAVEAADEPVEEPPPTQTDVAETVVSTVTQEGENVDAAPPPVVEDEVFDLAAVQEQPEFPGGMEKMYEFMGKTQKYPDMEYEAGIQGKVYVQFTVAKDGSIEEAKVLRSVSDGLDKEALRMVKSMPKWSPGKMGGKPVKCRFNLPVVFKLK